MKGLLKTNIPYSRRERLIHRLIHFFFKEELEDLIADARGDGFSEGYAVGSVDAQNRVKNGYMDLYENGKEDGKKEYFLSLCSFNPESVVRISANKLFIGGKELKENEANILKEEALMLKGTKIWEFFKNTITEQAYQTMFTQSQTFDDMKTGKLMLFNLDLLEKLRIRFENYQISQKTIQKPIDYGRISEDMSSVKYE